MKIREMFKKHKKKVIILTAAALILVIGVGAFVVFRVMKSAKGDGSFSMGSFWNSNGMSGMMNTEGVVSASGVTSVGMNQETFEVENLSEGLLIEEVYVSSGEEVAEGDVVLKLSEDTVALAREELEAVLKEAELAYRTGAIEYQQNLITIQYDRDLAVLGGEQAQEIYNETIASLKDQVDSAQEALDETKEQIAEYQALVEGDDYYNTYKVGEYKALYDENLELLQNKMEEWGISWSQVISGGGGQSSFGGMSSAAGSRSVVSGGENVSGGDAMGGADYGQGADSGQTTDPGYTKVLTALYSVLEQNLKDYEQAQADYEEACSDARLTLQTLELGLSSKEEALAQAKEQYETQILEAKLTLETSLADAERAQSDYETALEKAESDFESLTDTWEDAKENLELFESSVGDGYYRATVSGTIMSVMTRAGQYLTSEGMIFMCRNTEELTVTVSVDQEDIAKIEVGGTAYVQSSDYGSFNGTVSSINPVSTSESRANVTYQVTVSLSGDTETLPANETVTVLFGLGGNTDEKEN
ncbi:MAG: HlyD family efflux transporter periplasmic adaptor subunit [Lachnospiraceae bacterium]|nr:HlyD family efflux transporter periplasmic adaptor subunit [Lachnospiraceae bacterium]